MCTNCHPRRPARRRPPRPGRTAAGPSCRPASLLLSLRSRTTRILLSAASPASLALLRAGPGSCCSGGRLCPLPLRARPRRSATARVRERRRRRPSPGRGRRRPRLWRSGWSGRPRWAGGGRADLGDGARAAPTAAVSARPSRRAGPAGAGAPAQLREQTRHPAAQIADQRVGLRDVVSTHEQQRARPVRRARRAVHEHPMVVHAQWQTGVGPAPVGRGVRRRRGDGSRRAARGRERGRRTGSSRCGRAASPRRRPVPRGRPAR
jgi:hypothetical protein